MFDKAFKDAFEQDGYAIARRLFSTEEVAALTGHYMYLRQNGSYRGDSAGVEAPNGDPTADPLKQFPRMIHMHRWDDLSLQWMLDPRFREGLATLLGGDPFAVQSMIYFKPPGARGQALHQDQFYLQVEPGTCMAAWLALDDCDEENGCLQVVPGSHTLPELCTEEADTAQSFTDVTVPLPEQVQTVPVLMGCRRRALLQRPTHPRQLSEYDQRPLSPFPYRPLHHGQRRKGIEVLPSGVAHGWKLRGSRQQRAGRPLRRVGGGKRPARGGNGGW